MKTISWLLLIALFFQQCNSSANRREADDDSLQYYPPTPVSLNKDEFRHYYRAVNEFMDTSLLDKGFNGGILIAKNGAIIYEKYRGLIDLRKKDSITASTSLHIASTSKTFTATAILRMVKEGKLFLDDSVNKFFPGFPYPGITVKMLLCHRSGLPNYLYFLSNSDWDKKVYAQNKDVLDFLIKSKPDKSFTANSRMAYCNTNYVLLALIIEKISGRSFPEYMKEKFFEPLQMKNTYVFSLKDTLAATPSFSNNGTYWNYDFLDGTYGDKNIYSTPQDLLKWDQAFYTEQILNKELLDSAFKGYSFEKPSIHNYGLGWRLEFLPNGKRVIYHYGKWHGFNSAFARLPDEKVTIIILGNRFTRAVYNAGYFSYDIFGDYMRRQPDAEEESENADTVKKQTPADKRSKKSHR
ncbi:MAG: beta-lactamase family protein [Sphingobacteriales bacterium]|nr:beta-lactamase family protein [Sphingobacteriales bacterium]